MPRLMDMGLERLSNVITDMAAMAQESVLKALLAYEKGERITQEAFTRSNKLSTLDSEVDELAVELLARYQPVAGDLRFIVSCLEISNGFSRFGRYAYDISQVLEIYGDISQCDKSLVRELGDKVVKMIQTSIQSFKTRDTKLAKSIRQDDDQVDRMYAQYVKELSLSKSPSIKCALASTLVLRYLERIADHACYIGDSVTYIETGSKI